MSTGLKAPVVRVSYNVPPDPADEYDSGHIIRHSGRMVDLLVMTYDRWLCGMAERPVVTLGFGQTIGPDETEAIMEAMRLVGARA